MNCFSIFHTLHRKEGKGKVHQGFSIGIVTKYVDFHTSIYISFSRGIEYFKLRSFSSKKMKFWIERGRRKGQRAEG